MKFFEFAYSPDFQRKVVELASLCPEKWSFGNSNDNSILQNYLFHTFAKLYDEGNILEENDYALFNTGLFTPNYEALYAYFDRNKNPNYQKWHLSGFLTPYQLGLIQVVKYPRRANYFTNPADLVFDTNCNIICQYSHIFGDPDNVKRLPLSLQNNSTAEIIFDGAVTRARKMIEANYKTAVPQYYNNRIQLLIPLFLLGNTSPDLALVVSKSQDGSAYLGHTCLTLNMAYNNARLIARPDSAWLHP